jgi:hypothetical protein
VSEAHTYHGLRCTRCFGTERWIGSTCCVSCVHDGVEVYEGVPPHIAASARKQGFTEEQIQFFFGALSGLAPGFDLDHEFEPAGTAISGSGPTEGEWEIEKCTACSAGTIKSTAGDGDDFARFIAALANRGCDPKVRRDRRST